MNVQPLDRNTVKFYLSFNNDSTGKQRIDTPKGIESLDLAIKQNDDGYGRYEDFSDGLTLEFVRNGSFYGYQFEQLVRYFRTYGWHSNIGFIMELDGIEFINGKLDIQKGSLETDMQYYFKCKVIFDEYRENIDNREQTEVDLTNNLGIDTRTIIGGIESEEIVTKAKKFFKQYTYSDRDYETTTKKREIGYITSSSINPGRTSYLLNIKNIGENNDVTNVVTTQSFIPAVGSEPYLQPSFPNNTYIGDIFSRSHLKLDFESELTIDIEDLIIKYTGQSNLTFLKLTAVWTTYTDKGYTDVVNNGYLVLRTINDLNENIINLNSQNIFLPKFTLLAVVVEIDHNNNLGESVKYEINTNSFLRFNVIDVFKDTETIASRFINIGEQIVKNITNGQINTFDAPIFKTDSGVFNFKDVFVTSGYYLRGFDKKEFIAEWRDWLDTLRYTFNCDWQINKNKVFVGHYTDFYKNEEIYRIKFNPQDDLKIVFNERLQSSNVRMNYENFEDDETNTIESIHTESNFLVNETRLIDVEIEKDIPYIADIYKIEYTRREALEEDSTKSTTEDNDLYMIDCFDSVYNNEDRIVNRTDELYSAVNNLFSSETAYNLRFSLKRILIDNYAETLAEYSQYNKLNPLLTNQYYKNNGDCEMIPAGASNLVRNIPTIEKGDIDDTMLNKPIVDGLAYEINLSRRFKYNEYYDLKEAILNLRGYVTFFDENMSVKLYISELKYDWNKESLTVFGEKKYDTI